MRALLLILLISFIFIPASKAQEGFKLGVEATPSWRFNIQKQEPIALLTTTSGYGFTLGMPIKWGFSESMALQTGVGFEMMLFDQRFNKTLISSNRHGSIHVPVQLSFALSGGWNFLAGVGLNYNIYNSQWTQLGSINISSATNKIQPYGAAGISTLMDRGNGMFELGLMGRYHFLDLYNGETTFADPDLKNWIFSADLVLRYYLICK